MAWLYECRACARCILVIQSSRSSSLFTGNKALQFIDKISYSVYLVHWPVIVISKKIGYDIEFWHYIVLTTILSLIVHYLIERRNSLTYKSVFVGAMACIA